MEKPTENCLLILGIFLLAFLCGSGIFFGGLMPIGSVALRGGTIRTNSNNGNAEPTGLSEASGSSPLDAAQTPSPPSHLSATPISGVATGQELLPATPQVQPETTVTTDLLVVSITPEPTLTPYLMQPTIGPSATMAPIMLDHWCVPWNSSSVRATLQKVIDGVTISVSIDGKPYQVRYIGISMPEYSHDWTIWARSTAKNAELVEGKSLLLIKGLADADDEGQLSRYVIADGKLVNQELLLTGFAVAQDDPSDANCAHTFQAAQAEAVRGGRGLWSPTPNPTRTLRPPTPTIPSSGALVIVNVAYRGTIWQEPEEYVEVYNSGILPIQLQGWSVSDIDNHTFVFPEFILGQGQYCRVYTNLYRPTECGFSFFRQSPVWDNSGDCAFLRDATGRLVDKFSYP